LTFGEEFEFIEQVDNGGGGTIPQKKTIRIERQLWAIQMLLNFGHTKLARQMKAEAMRDALIEKYGEERLKAAVSEFVRRVILRRNQ
jgi:hypothetical protein